MNRILAFVLGLAVASCSAAPAFAQQAATPFYANTGTSFTAQKGLDYSRTAPVIVSGFGTAPTILGVNSTAFLLTIGSGGTATSGVISLGAPAPHGWACDATDATSLAAMDTKATSLSTTQITVTNFPAAGGAASAFNAGDQIAISCAGY
jgi:hypothetical protein